jgi:multidrug efflux pump subunit AcrA (membrane-fusion protein)
VSQRVVELGVPLDGTIEVRSGLEAGTRVAADGAHYLSDGAKVRLQEDGV